MNENIWEYFKEKNNLDSDKLKKFEIYYNLLKETNDLHNLTAITQLKSVINYHFQDSIALCDFLDCSKVKSIADVGSGGGFPGIPIKIIKPDLSLTLIEVNQKKVEFLNNLIDTLKLENCQVIDLDWRTFLRKTELDIDLFCARASLSPEELIRMFKPSCYYKNSKLIYWASKKWQPNSKEKEFIKKEFEYLVGNKLRKLILLSQNN